MDRSYLSQCDADSIQLQQLLQTALLSVRSTSVSGQGHGDDHTEILNLACGPCREAGALVASFQNEAAISRRSIRITGADIRAAEIEEARSRAAAFKEGGVESEFIVFDCSRLDRLTQLEKSFDFVFLRHQNYWNAPQLWARIFEQGLSRLKEGGILGITSYFDREHDLAIKALKRAGASLLLTVRNPHSRKLPTPGKSVDRHLALFGIVDEAKPDPGKTFITLSTACSQSLSVPLL